MLGLERIHHVEDLAAGLIRHLAGGNLADEAFARGQNGASSAARRDAGIEFIGGARVGLDLAQGIGRLQRARGAVWV
jgi:hypothetical protein